MAPYSLFLLTIAVLSAIVHGDVDIINTGGCKGFAVLACTAVSFDGTESTVQFGSVGVTPGRAITGTYAIIAGSRQIRTAAANQCLLDLQSAHAIAAAAVCPASNVLSDLAGLTLLPGVYCFLGGAITMSAGSLTLDAGGDANAQWIFQAVSSLTTATATSVVLKNGAKATNVYWVLGTEVSIGYSSSFLGNIMTLTSITIGSNANFEGRLLAETAVTFASGSTDSLLAIRPASTRYLRMPDYPKKFSVKSIPLGSCTHFALMSGTVTSFSGGLTTVTSGSVGVSPGTSATGAYLLGNGKLEIISTPANACANDRITAYNALAAAVCPPSNIRAELSGLTLFPGVYCSTSTLSLSENTLTLNGLGDPDAQWIFQAPGGLKTSPYTSVILMNGAQAQNIFWQIGSSASLGYASSFMGTIIAYASISFDHNSVLIGRGLAGAAVSFVSTATVCLPMM